MLCGSAVHVVLPPQCMWSILSTTVEVRHSVSECTIHWRTVLYDPNLEARHQTANRNNNTHMSKRVELLTITLTDRLGRANIRKQGQAQGRHHVIQSTGKRESVFLYVCCFFACVCDVMCLLCVICKLVLCALFWFSFSLHVCINICRYRLRR